MATSKSTAHYPSPSPSPSPALRPLSSPPLSTIPFPLRRSSSSARWTPLPPSPINLVNPIDILPSSYSRRPSISTLSAHPSISPSSGETERHVPAAYSSLPPSPTKSFADLADPLIGLTLDMDILRRRFSMEPRVENPSGDGDEDEDEGTMDRESQVDQGKSESKKTSLWDHLQEEIWANDLESGQELKCFTWGTNRHGTDIGERVSNFIQVPLAIEKLIVFGSLVCLDSFLHVFTILPIRSFIALCSVGKNYFDHVFRRRPLRHLAPTQRIDIIKFLLVLLSCVVLVWGTDASFIYHSIRGQDSIKLVVIFGAFEIADKLCCAFGQDVLDSMFARETLGRRPNGSRPHFRPFFFFCLSLICVVMHTLVFLFQLISLNVAINSFDNALLTLLISNQFVEIKGSVFKKFEKENLFQIACADIVERFQLGLMLAIIAFRNLVELSGSDFSSLPRSFMKGTGHLEAILSPALIVLSSEMVVDWLKHAYITKFNHIRVSTYERFTDVLCRDLVTAGKGGLPSGKKHALADQSPLVSRRLGFASLPLACLVIRIGMQAIGMASRRVDSRASSLDVGEDAFRGSDAELWAGIALGGCVIWVCLVAFKIILGINLLNYASRRFVGMEDRRDEDDELNHLARSPLGEGAQEKSYNKQLSKFLDQDRDNLTLLTDLPSNALPAGSHPPPTKQGKKKVYKLEDITRYTMVKRIF